MSLREKILKALAGSSGQNPTYLSDLEKLVGAAGKGELHTLLEAMYAAREVNCASGMKEGKFYDAYWLTGAQTHTPAFSITGRQPIQRAPIVRTEAQAQPNTAKVKPTASIPPIQSKENTVSKTQSKGLGQLIVDIVDGHADGINVSDLHKKVEDKMPGTTFKQVLDLSYWLHGQQKIERRGKGQKATLHPYTADAKVTPPAEKKKPAAPIASPAPQPTPKPANPKAALECSFHINGGMTIRKGAETLELDSNESLRLMKFATHQLQFASALPA